MRQRKQGIFGRRCLPMSHSDRSDDGRPRRGAFDGRSARRFVRDAQRVTITMHGIDYIPDSKAQTSSSLDKDRTQHGGPGRLVLEPGWEVVADGGVGDGEPSSSSTHTHSEPFTASLDVKVGWGNWKYTVYSRQWDCLVHFTHENPQEANEQSRGAPSVEERRG